MNARDMANPFTSQFFRLNSPIAWAFSFVAADLALLFVIYISAMIRRMDDVVIFGFWWSATDWTLHIWNFLHAPCRWLLEPMLFPIVISHPQYPSDLTYGLYYVACVMQMALVGYVFGVIARARAAHNSRKTQ